MIDLKNESSNFTEVPDAPNELTESIQRVTIITPVEEYTEFPPISQANSIWNLRGTRVAGIYIASSLFSGLMFFGIFFIISSLFLFSFASKLDDESDHSNPLRVAGSITISLGLFFIIVGIGGMVYSVRAAKRAFESPTVTYQVNPTTTSETPGENSVLAGSVLAEISRISAKHSGYGRLVEEQEIENQETASTSAEGKVTLTDLNSDIEEGIPAL